MDEESLEELPEEDPPAEAGEASTGYLAAVDAFRALDAGTDPPDEELQALLDDTLAALYTLTDEEMDLFSRNRRSCWTWQSAAASGWMESRARQI